MELYRISVSGYVRTNLQGHLQVKFKEQTEDIKKIAAAVNHRNFLSQLMSHEIVYKNNFIVNFKLGILRLEIKSVINIINNLQRTINNRFKKLFKNVLITICLH